MLKITPFRKLGLMYLIALASIVLTIVVSQILIQTFIQKQAFDSRVINVAGKQRMLSQKISKIALKLQNNPYSYGTYENLEVTLDLWKYSHESLQSGSDSIGVSGDNSIAIIKLFKNVEPYFQQIVKSAQTILNTTKQDTITINQSVNEIIQVEGLFLEGMDAIVNQYDREAKLKVQRLKRLEYVLFGVAILIIILEFLFLFLPTSKRVVRTFNDLVKSEEAAKKMTAEVNKVYAELGKSYQDLESVNLKPDERCILLKCESTGRIESISERFKEIMSVDAHQFVDNLFTWLSSEGYNEEFLTKLQSIMNSGNTWSGELNVTDSEGDLIWLDIFFQPISKNGQGQKILAIGRDITEIKEAKQRSREINRETIEKRVKEQQYRSVLILEGQEEERKRISAEIHDGIGQMLTGLKMNLEGISPTDAPHMKKRIKDTKELMSSVIKEVRRVSFNLAPSSLVDFGISPALKKISQEITALTNTTVSFENKTGFINRLDKIVETNLYRIVQEGVNNAIKYSGGSEIKIRLEHNHHQLNVSVEDNGKGFEKEKLEKAGHFGASGHGIFNMKERAAYINAQFDVDTEINRGTKIKITLPLS